ncbi:MAG: DEAD/DEAH box helicase, partial [Actinomycetota bacterium]
VGARDGRPTLLTQDRRSFRAAVTDFPSPPEPLATIDLPRGGSTRSARYRRDLAARLAALRVTPPAPKREQLPASELERAQELEERAERHPCHGCPERADHERWAVRGSRLAARIAKLERRIQAQTETLARQFDRVLDVLEELGYISHSVLSEDGERLRRIYGEADILVAEALAQGLFDDLGFADFAALASSFIYEARDRAERPELPSREIRERLRRLQTIWRRVREVEERHHVELCRELDSGFAATIFDWAEGKSLDDVLGERGTAPGDFVRTCKQILDLLRQIEEVGEPEVGSGARAAHDAVNRGVVAYTGL